MARPKPASAPVARTGDPRTDTTVPNPIEGDPTPKERAADGPTVPVESLAATESAPDRPVIPEPSPLDEPLGTLAAADEPEYDLVRGLWHGDPGRGKTTAMLTLANRGKVLLWDAENRLKRGALRRAGVNVDNIERVTEVSYESMKRRLAEAHERVVAGDLFGICFDGGTEMTRMLIASRVDEGVATAARKGFERSEWQTYQEDYGDVTEQFRRILRIALRIPCHFGMTTLSQRHEGPSKEVRIIPHLTPAIARDVNSAMDIICYLRVDEVGEHLLRSGVIIPGSSIEAKDTFGVLPRRMANPTFERMLDYVNEVLTRDQDPEQEAAAALVAKSNTEE